MCRAILRDQLQFDPLTEWEKNQYHWFVDPEGNQIPYMDGAVMWSAEGGKPRRASSSGRWHGEEDGRTSYVPACRASALHFRIWSTGRLLDLPAGPAAAAPK